MWLQLSPRVTTEQEPTEVLSISATYQSCDDSAVSEGGRSERLSKSHSLVPQLFGGTHCVAVCQAGLSVFRLTHSAVSVLCIILCLTRHSISLP